MACSANDQQKYRPIQPGCLLHGVHINVIRLLVVGSVENGVMRVAQSKLDDIEAVQMGHAAATGGLSMGDIDEFFKPLEKSALAEA